MKANEARAFPLFYESGTHQIFLEALQEMGWSWRIKLKEA